MKWLFKLSKSSSDWSWQSWEWKEKGVEAGTLAVTARGQEWNKWVSSSPCSCDTRLFYESDTFPTSVFSLLYAVAIFQSRSLKMCIIMAKSKSKFQKYIELKLTAVITVLSVLFSSWVLFCKGYSWSNFSASNWSQSSIHKAGNHSLVIYHFYLQIKTWPIIGLQVEELPRHFWRSEVSSTFQP